MRKRISILPKENKPILNRRSLHHVNTWIFDLDRTLYSAESDLFAQIEQRMCAFIMTMCHMEREEAWSLQKKCYLEYGTTLKGLIETGELERNGLIPDDFLRYVHDIDYSSLKKNVALDDVLGKIPCRKVIFTNGTSRHAARATEALGIKHHFDDIFDIHACNYMSKPSLESYRLMLEHLKIDPEKAAFFEDSYENLPIAAGMGMVTIWLRHKDDKTPLETVNPKYCHYVIEDLTGWLRQMVKIFKEII
ncbi:MAG: pyrimidine 5'-nucleotidase [Alphaproteobacteria bacterium]|nr:pyrimidine 5'-nucleotidase [Alphaproteobacteria bacterium]